MSIFKVLSLNVRGINYNKKRRKLFLWLRKQDTDIVFLQETHITCESERIWTNEWGGEIVFSHGTNQSRSVAILFQKNFEYNIEKTHTDSEGRFVELAIKIEDEAFKLLNLYPPNKINCQVNFFRRLKNLLTREESQYNDNIVIGGDFNCVMNDELDKKGGVI